MAVVDWYKSKNTKIFQICFEKESKRISEFSEYIP